MTFNDYLAAPGLSHSGLKDLAISPLRFWHRHVNPARPAEEPTAEMRFGTALHCAVLEPHAFLDRFACEVSAEDYPGCLVTMDDLRGWLREHGIQPKGQKKADAIAQVQAADRNVPILEVLEARTFAQNRGKALFKKKDWTRIYGAAESLRAEPRVKQLLSEGEFELTLFGKDAESGVDLKARLDWDAPQRIVDIKTFSHQGGTKTIDRTVTDAIFYQDYHGQGFFYSLLKGWPKWKGEFVLAFVESEPPYETRIRTLRPYEAGTASMLWERARQETRRLIRIYAEYAKEFGLGERPWRYAQDVSVLDDLEFPQLSYA